MLKHMNKVVLITGASSGIGLATAKKLLGEGCTVYASARSDDSVAELQNLGGIPLRIEMAEKDTMVAAVNRIIEEQGRIDVLFNNAGHGFYGPIEEVPLAEARRVLEVNLFGLARLTQLVLPHMRKQRSGIIINTSSIGGKVYTPLGAWYHASKHALEGWSDCLRLEVRSLGINVVIVEPGIIHTGFNERMVSTIKELTSSGGYDWLKTAVLKTLDADDKGSPPSVIADLVSKILQSDNPKPRYHAGKLAGLVLFVRRYFSDRFFDRFIMSQVKKYSAN